MSEHRFDIYCQKSQGGSGWSSVVLKATIQYHTQTTNQTGYIYIYQPSPLDAYDREHVLVKRNEIT